MRDTEDDIFNTVFMRDTETDTHKLNEFRLFHTFFKPPFVKGDQGDNAESF